MNGGDNSLIGGMISAVTLVGLNTVVSRVTSRNRKAEKLVDGQPRVLISNGRAFLPVLKAEDITHDEMMAALRHAGCEKIEEVRLAVLETNGSISVIKKD